MIANSQVMPSRVLANLVKLMEKDIYIVQQLSDSRRSNIFGDNNEEAYLFGSQKEIEGKIFRKRPYLKVESYKLLHKYEAS